MAIVSVLAIIELIIIGVVTIVMVPRVMVLDAGSGSCFQMVPQLVVVAQRARARTVARGATFLMPHRVPVLAVYLHVMEYLLHVGSTA